jgi:excisionase family DNA binding protein
MTHALAFKAMDPSELDQVNTLAASLPQGSPVAVLLHSVVSAMSRGADVTLFESDAELSPNEAADLLRMSRPHLLKFMDRGELDFHRVGSHRRIRVPDLLDFIDRHERAKASVAHALGNATAINSRVRDRAGTLSQTDLDQLDSL